MSKYAPELTSAIIENLKKGNGRIRAIENIISYNTLVSWMDSHPDFKSEVIQAENQGHLIIKEFAEAKIIKAMEEHWQAAAWWLERKYKNEYAQRAEMSGIDGKDLKITFVMPEGSCQK